MAIENNLPVIFDTATQSEDGLMSCQDKVKLDNIDVYLENKLNKDDKISVSQLDISSDDTKIKLEHLSEEVITAIAGTAEISATVPKNGVSTEKIQNNAVTIDKIDKRFLLGNVVSPRPINFAFNTKQVSINIPQGSLLMLDSITKRELVTGVSTENKVVTLNYPTEFDGLNFIVSKPDGTMEMVNHRKSNTISNTNSIVALVYLSTTYDAAIVMHGSYTINGLAQGIGTESAALMCIGKIVFDKLTGIIDFTEATELHLIIGGVFNRTIQNQASIRLSNYTEDSTYVLYWNHATQALETELATASNTDTDIAKIALIKDGLIIPFVDTRAFYSKPYIEAPYYTENFDKINNIILSSKEKINIVSINEQKIEFPEDTVVCLNQQTLEVKTKECQYIDRMGLHYILFDLDEQTISCRHYAEVEDTTKKNIVVGTMYISANDIIVSGNFEYTINGKTSYEDDLSYVTEGVDIIWNTINSDIVNNRILVGNEIYMIDNEELPIYESSMLIESTEGIKPAIGYNKNNNDMTPRISFFTGNTSIDNTMGDNISLLAYDKYNTHAYLKQEVAVKKVSSDHKNNQDIKLMCLGDDLINDKIAYYINNKLISLGMNVEMLGTMDNNHVYGEGRDGWFYSTFLGASGRGVGEGKITPQTARGSSSILMNPFLRIANADDKASNPNNCFRATGSYTEKSYYSDSDKNGAFYIFDFAKYLEVQGIENPDVIIIAIKPESMSLVTEDIVSANMMSMKQLITGIRSALPDTYIGIIPQYGACTIYEDMWKITYKMITETIDYIKDLGDDKIKVISAWLHMNREFGTEYICTNSSARMALPDVSINQLYQEVENNQTTDKLSEVAKIELANAITAFIMNI